MNLEQAHHLAYFTNESNELQAVRLEVLIKLKRALQYQLAMILLYLY